MSEPVVIASDISRVVREAVRPDDPDFGEAVRVLAERASTSTRTVYRVIGDQVDTLSLDLADRLALAAGRQLSEIGCKVRHSDGRLLEYGDA